MSLAQWRNISQPDGACTMINVTGKPLNDLIEWVFSNYNQNHTMEMQTCERFEFDTFISDTTIQSEWNVVCNNRTFLSVIEMCFLAGAAIGSLSSGGLSDEYGRRHSLMIFVALQAIIGKYYVLSGECRSFL